MVSAQHSLKYWLITKQKQAEDIYFPKTGHRFIAQKLSHYLFSDLDKYKRV